MTSLNTNFLTDEHHQPTDAQPTVRMEVIQGRLPLNKTTKRRMANMGHFARTAIEQLKAAKENIDSIALYQSGEQEAHTIELEQMVSTVLNELEIYHQRHIRAAELADDYKSYDFPDADLDSR